MTVPDGTEISVVAGPVSFNGSAVPENPRRAPGLGEHSDEILLGIGVDENDLEHLRARNVIA